MALPDRVGDQSAAKERREHATPRQEAARRRGDPARTSGGCSGPGTRSEPPGKTACETSNRSSGQPTDEAANQAIPVCWKNQPIRRSKDKAEVRFYAKIQRWYAPCSLTPILPASSSVLPWPGA